eukprot:g15256.t1
MADTAKEESKAPEPAAAPEQPPAAVAAATAAAVPQRKHLTDDELLRKHYPRYFYDKKEKFFPVDLNAYTADKSAVDGCNGVAAPSKDGEHTWLIYMNYYLYDGGVAKLGGKGGHKYDLEIVVVEVKKRGNQRVTGVFYGPHSSFEHMWIRHKDDLKTILNNEGRPRVFVSLGKHASYPVSGRVVRLFGLGTDTCHNPRANDRPLIILDERTRDVERIDGKFGGPKNRISRDWSTAPQSRIKNVRKRRAVPPAKQISKELSKLAFWRNGIQTLREQETSSVLSQLVNVHPRSWRSPTSAHKQQQQQQQQQQPSKRDSSASCLQNAQPATCTGLQNAGPSSSASCATTMVCNTAAKRPFFDTSASSSSSSDGGVGRQDSQDLHSSSSSAIGSKAARTVTSSTQLSSPAPAAAANVTTSPSEDAGMYDPEALLLEPLLISPRSERQNPGGGGGSSSVCENVLQDDRIMSQSIGGGNVTGSNGTSNFMASRWESEEVSGTTPSSMHMSSSSSARPLVPASPSISGVQAGAPSFIPDQPLRGGGRRAGAEGSGAHANNNWYLDFPPNQPTQLHQHHHAHFHHHSAGSTPAAGQPSSAASLATAAANIAAEISQAAGNVAPSSFPTPGSASYPPVEHGMRAITGEDDMACSGGGGGGGGGGGYDGYAADSRHRTSSSWVTAAGGQQQQQQQDGNSSSMSVDSSTAGGYRHPRFVTREDCVPGSRFPRGNSSSSGGGGGSSDAVEEGRASAGMMHSYGIEVPFPRSSAENDAMNLNVSGWQQNPSSSGAKRPHSVLGGGASGTFPSSSSSTSSVAFAEGSSSSAPSVSTTQMAARLSPTMLSAHGQQGGKKMKVLGAADGSQGWANLPRSDNNNSKHHNSDWGVGAGGGAGNASAALSAGMSVMVPGSMGPGSPGVATLSSGGVRRRSGRAGTPAEANAAARAALAATFPPNPTVDEDDESGGAAGSCGGDSSPDWTERDESEEEEASPVPSSSSKGGGGGGGGKAKIPFMLDPKLWTVVERRAICNAKQCAYRNEDDHRARRRHYHALCSHVHQNGERKGMRFQHHQLEKVQKHQRAHQNTQRSSAGKPRSPCSSPVPRSKRTSATNGQKEQTRAIKDANVEAHSPKDWTPELTKRLRELVDELGPKWSLIADKIPGKTATACMLHWRVGLNPNHLVKGSGTWTAEEDERLSKLVEVVGMKWSDLARHIPGRIAKQCRERYLNHLDPSLRKDMPWTEDEEALLMRLCFAKQNQWAEICRQLHGRSYNDVKNRFNLIQRRNKRAQSGTPTTPSTPATPNVPQSASDLKPIRRGRGATAPAVTVSAATAAVTGAPYAASTTRTRGVNTPAPVPAPSSFASGRAVAAGGWGPAAAAAAAAAAGDGTGAGAGVGAHPTANNDTGGNGNGNGVSSATAAPSSSLGLMGDELGEFGLDGSESTSPGSGFAPGGYWHQMVKEEARGARESDEDSAKSGRSSPSAGPPAALSSVCGSGQGASVVDPSPTGRGTRFSQNGSPLP